MRLFVAIDLPEAVRGALEQVQAAVPLGRVMEPETLHLTLAFLGERDRHEAEAAHEALERVRGTAFDLRLAGLGTFRASGALWAGVARTAPVKVLQGKVAAALAGAGIVLERRRFRPHVTLARLGEMRRDEEERLARFLSVWSGFPAPEFRVTQFALYRSTLLKSGPVYEVLAEYPLEAAREAAGSASS
jgi:2'-5' RNA ligase